MDEIPVYNRAFLDIHPLFCGCEDCKSGHSYGPAVRDCYLIHHVRSGKGVFSCAGREYPVSKGQCFLICPRQITCYTADTEHPWHYTWIAFDGEYAQTFLKSAGLVAESPIIDSPRVSALFENLYYKILDGEMYGGKNELNMLSMLYGVFSVLPQSAPEESQHEIYIKKVRSYVTGMYANPISIEKLALHCGLDRRYLCRVFKAGTGQTLQQYIIGLKMDKARDLLLSSTLTVGDIARSVGYTDIYNFSKMFKKQYGLSPVKLRGTHTGSGSAPDSARGGCGN